MIEKIKQLRLETGISLKTCKEVLEQTNGNIEEAKKLLLNMNTTNERIEKETNEGIVISYIHPNSKLGVLLNICCETDFVAKNSNFIKLANDIAIHIGATDPIDVESLLHELYIKDESIMIYELIANVSFMLGENIIVKQFSRFSI